MSFENLHLRVFYLKMVRVEHEKHSLLWNWIAARIKYGQNYWGLEKEECVGVLIYVSDRMIHLKKFIEGLECHQ